MNKYLFKECKLSESSSEGYTYKISPTPKAWESLGRQYRKTLRVKESGSFTVRLGS